MVSMQTDFLQRLRAIVAVKRQNDSDTTRTNKNPMWPLVFLLALTFIVFAPSLKGEFVMRDDNSYVVENPTLRLPGIKEVFTTSPLGYYHPLTILSYKIEYSVAGTKPALYRATNIVLHLANCGLVYYFMLLAGGDIAAALFTTMLFALHPLRVEAVAWISSRKDLLACLFLMGMLTTYLHYLKSFERKWLWTSAILFAFALLSKPVVLLAPLILPFFDWRAGRAISSEILLEKTPYLVPAAGICFLSFFLDKFFINSSISGDGFLLGQRFAMCGYATSFYIGKLLWPANLSSPYPALRLPPGFWACYLHSASITIIFGCFFAARALRRHLFGPAFFALTLLPVLPFMNFIPADKYTYIPAFGLFYTAGFGFSWVYKRIQLGSLSLALGLAVGLAYISFHRVKVWNTNLSLCNDVIAKEPPNLGMKGATGGISSIEFTYAVTHLNRGLTYANLNRYNEAIADYNKAIALDPSGACGAHQAGAAHNSRGIANYALKRYDEAIADCTRAIILDPSGTCGASQAGTAYNNRGSAYLAIKQYDKALADYTKAIQLNPEFSNAYSNRAIVYGSMGNHGLALADFTKALALDASNETATIGKTVAEKMLGSVKPATDR